jgi:hypothetical protein
MPPPTPRPAPTPRPPVQRPLLPAPGPRPGENPGPRPGGNPGQPGYGAERDPVPETRLQAADVAVTDRQVALEAAEGVPTLQLVATVAVAADEGNRCPHVVPV